MPKSDKITRVKFSDLILHTNNANRGSERGEYMLRRSMEKFGFAEAGTLDRNNKMVAGNHRTETAEDVLNPEEAIIVDVDGKTPVYIRRNDIDLDTPEGKELAIALNRVAQISIDFDPEQIKLDLEAGIDLSDWFREWMPPEAGEWGQAFGGLPDSDRAPFQQMTFTLHDSQKTIVDEAIRAAKAAGDFSDSPNQNSNGNALAYICEVFANGQG